MECDRAAPLLQRWHDGELNPLRRFVLARHLAHCPACSAQLDELQSMRAMIRDALPYHRAPPDLAVRIGALLPREPEAPPLPVRRWMPRWGLAGAGLGGALAGAVLTLLVAGQRGPDDSSVMESVINSHIRSLMADHLTDVATSDQHTVKPWLSARLPVSPPVPELAAEGFPLVGGRMDFIDGHPAAAVVYRHQKHVINLFAWASPGKPDQGFHTETRQGFNTLTWRHGGMTFFAVSDVEADQLAAFARLVAAAAD